MFFAKTEVRWTRCRRTLGQMRTFVPIVFVASFALAQGKPAPARDAGVAPAVAPVRSAAAVDGGVAAPVPTAAQAQAVSNVNSMEVDKLRKEVAELRARTAELERQQQTAKSESVNGKLDTLTRQVDELKAQLTQLNEVEARRSDREQSAATQRSDTVVATSNLNSVLGALSSGNTSGVEPSLRYAESVFTGSAQKNVQLARGALAQGDLNMARQYLLLAISEAQGQR